jgi:hypothetical protein
VAGFAWGVVIRVWMRYISTNPEFTWSGTGYIIGAATVVGGLAGFGYRRWRLGRGNWWRMSGLSLLLLGMAAGSIMIPSVLAGGLGIGRKTWNRWLRGLLLTLAVGFQAWLFLQDPNDFPPGRLVPALAWYFALLGVEMWAASIPFRPSRSDVPGSGTREPLPKGAGG